jgi:hypothetical protein
LKAQPVLSATFTVRELLIVQALFATFQSGFDTVIVGALGAFLSRL